MGWLVESDVIFCIDNEVTGIDVIALKNHFEYFWVVDSALFHEVNDFILNNNCMINIVI